MTQIYDPQVDADVPEGTNVLHVLDGTGDTRIMWDPNDRSSVDLAKKTFDEAKSKGFLAYMVGPQGEQTDTVISAFDKNLSKVIMVPQLVGG